MSAPHFQFYEDSISSSQMYLEPAANAFSSSFHLPQDVTELAPSTTLVAQLDLVDPTESTLNFLGEAQGPRRNDLALRQPMVPAPSTNETTQSPKHNSAGSRGTLDLGPLIRNAHEDGKPAPAPVDQESLAALVNSRERDVKELANGLAMPLSSWNAKYIWFCVMKRHSACDPELAQKIKEIHRAFYVPPAISFYALWLFYRFWTVSPTLYFTVEARLPASFGAKMQQKETRVAMFMYYLAVLFANKHLDDFSYRNSSWYEAAGIPAGDFLHFELVALQELKWSLEIKNDEWVRWIEHLQASNNYLENAGATNSQLNWAIGGSLFDAILALRTVQSFGSSYSGSSAAGSSPSGSPYNGHQRQQPVNVKAAPVHTQPTAKYIPWDTTQDPIVALPSHRSKRSVSISSKSWLGAENSAGCVGGGGGNLRPIRDVGGGWGGNDVYDGARRRGVEHQVGITPTAGIEGSFAMFGKRANRTISCGEFGRPVSLMPSGPLKNCNMSNTGHWTLAL